MGSIGTTASNNSIAYITSYEKSGFEVWKHLRAIERYNTNTLDPNQEEPTGGSSGSIRATTSSGSSSSSGSVTPMGGY